MCGQLRCGVVHSTAGTVVATAPALLQAAIHHVPAMAAAAAPAQPSAPPDLARVLRHLPAHILKEMFSSSQRKDLRLLGDREILSIVTELATSLWCSPQYQGINRDLRRLSAKLSGLTELHMDLCGQEESHNFSSAAKHVDSLLSDICDTRVEHSTCIQQLHVSLNQGEDDELTAEFIPDRLLELKELVVYAHHGDDEKHMLLVRPDAFSRAPGLRVLSLVSDSMYGLGWEMCGLGQALPAIAHSLVDLQLVAYSVPVDTLDALAACTQLEHLRINVSAVTPAGSMPTAQLGEAPADDDGLHSVDNDDERCASQLLRRLSLLAGCTRLRTLELGTTHVTGPASAYKERASLPTLDDVAPTLFAMHRLEKVCLGPLSQRGGVASFGPLMQQLPRCTNFSTAGGPLNITYQVHEDSGQYLLHVGMGFRAEAIGCPAATVRSLLLSMDACLPPGQCLDSATIVLAEEGEWAEGEEGEGEGEQQQQQQLRHQWMHDGADIGEWLAERCTEVWLCLVRLQSAVLHGWAWLSVSDALRALVLPMSRCLTELRLEYCLLAPDAFDCLVSPPAAGGPQPFFPRLRSLSSRDDWADLDDQRVLLPEHLLALARLQAPQLCGVGGHTTWQHGQHSKRMLMAAAVMLCTRPRPVDEEGQPGRLFLNLRSPDDVAADIIQVVTCMGRADWVTMR